MNKHDYCFINTPNGIELVRIVSTINGLRGRVEQDAYSTTNRRVVDVDRDTVILNVGPNPHPGHIYGFDVGNLYVKSVPHPKLGDLHFFYKPSKEVFTSIMRAGNILETKLRKHRLEFLLDDHIDWLIYKASGEKYAGMYIAKGEEVPRIIIRPESVTADQYVYVLAHELGHHLHYKYLNQINVNAAWLRLFTETIRVTPISSKSSKELLAILTDPANEIAPSRLRSAIEDSDLKVAYGKILSFVRTQHSISPSELDVLWQQSPDTISNLWPQGGLSVKDLKPVLTEYACKNYKELIAEAFAFYLVGSLPKVVNKLLERSLSVARSNR